MCSTTKEASRRRGHDGPRSRTPGRTIWTSVLLFVLASLAGALTPPGATAQATDRVDLENTRLPSLLGRSIRVVGPDRSVTGTLRVVETRAMTLSFGGAEQAVHVGWSDQIWVRDSNKKKGAIAGALAGVALTAGFCIETFDECGLDVGLLVITPLFALIGAGFGSTQPIWTRIWP